MIEDIVKLLEPQWTQVLELMGTSLKSDVPLLNSINSSLLANSGKLLRPMLSLLMSRCCGEAGQKSVRFAAAAEMLHNATLMHDDVADESMKRRGRPSVMSMVGPSSAVLVGDFWLARAVEVLLEVEDVDKRAVSLFSKTLTDLAEGEMLQLEKSREADTTLEDYFRIIYCKTASLFEASIVSGAISADAPQGYLEAAGQYARSCGIAFQIKDDILDYAGGETLGKPVGVDLKEAKITLPLLLSFDDPSQESAIRAKVLKVSEDPAAEEEIRSFVLSRGGVERASEVLDDYIGKALQALEVLPPSPERDCLGRLVRFNSYRTI